MTDFSEVKTSIDSVVALTKALGDKVAMVDQNDAVRQDEVKKLTVALADSMKARADAEAQWKAEMSEVKRMAEEASLKSGRRVPGAPENALSAEHKAAFLAHIRNPTDPDARRALKEVEAKAVDTVTGAAGGFAVPQLIDSTVAAKAREAAVMRGLVRVVTVGSSDWRQLIDKGGDTYGWVGETGTRAETSTPGLYEAVPTMGTLYAYPRATEESMDDMFFDVEGWLADSASASFALGEDVAIISGNGTDKPTGLLNATPVTTADGARANQVLQYVPTGAAGAFGSDAHANLVDLRASLRAGYRARASWLMNSMTAAAISKIKTSDGVPLWSESLVAGVPSMLLGSPVNICESMPDIAANAFPIAFGDFARGYTLVDRHGLRITRDEVTTPGYVKWNIRRRVGGCVTDDDAVKVQKFAAT